MDPKKHEVNEKRLIRWLLIATLALLVLVLSLQAWRMLFPSAPTASDNGSLTQDASLGPAAPQMSEPLNDPDGVTPGKAAMIEDVQTLNASLSFNDLAALSAEELEQLWETGAPGLPIGLSAAAQAAEEHAGTLEVDSVTWSADPELDESPAHYEVELHHITLGEFEYKIGAYTGEVLEGPANILQSAYVPASSDAAQTAPAGSAQGKTAAPSQPPTQPAAPKNGNPQASAPAAQQPAAAGGQSAQTGEDAAKAAAFAHAGVQEGDVTGLSIKLDWEDGVQVYEIEFRANGVEYDYEIDAATSAVRKAGQEWAGGTAAPSSGKRVSESDAKAAALAHAGVQAQNADYIRLELDWDDGVQIYEIDFVAAGVEYEYEIDASSGAILKAEQDQAD